MTNSQFVFRTVISWILVGALGFVIPLRAAQEPGILASSVPSGSAPRANLLREIAGISAFPRSARQEPKQTDAPVASAANTGPAKHHLPTWAWVAIVAGAGIAIGAGVLAANSQSGKTAATTTSVTVGAGTGITAGAP